MTAIIEIPNPHTQLAAGSNRDRALRAPAGQRRSARRATPAGAPTRQVLSGVQTCCHNDSARRSPRRAPRRTSPVCRPVISTA